MWWLKWPWADVKVRKHASCLKLDTTTCAWTYWVWSSPGEIISIMTKSFQSPHSSTKPLDVLFTNIQTTAFYKSCREVEVLPMGYACNQFLSAFGYLSRSTISSMWKNRIWALTMFEQQDSGKWESWSAAHECNWSPGIFTQRLINMLLKHAGTFCPQNKDTADNDDQKCLSFYQLLTDKLFECLGHPSLMWIDRHALYLKGAVIFKRPDGMKRKVVVFGVIKRNINIKALSSEDREPLMSSLLKPITDWLDSLNTQCWFIPVVLLPYNKRYTFCIAFDSKVKSESLPD